MSVQDLGASSTISDGLLFLMMGYFKIIEGNENPCLKLRVRPVGAIVLPIDFDKRNLAVIAQPRFGACGVVDNGWNSVGFGNTSPRFRFWKYSTAPVWKFQDSFNSSQLFRKTVFKKHWSP